MVPDLHTFNSGMIWSIGTRNGSIGLKNPLQSYPRRLSLYLLFSFKPQKQSYLVVVFVQCGSIMTLYCAHHGLDLGPIEHIMNILCIYIKMER
jgi:hypothetical protein